MNVDTDNFAAAKDLFQEHVSKSTFAALDLEMTGIFSRSDSDRIGQGDTPSIRYAKQRRTVTQYGIVQIGICLFEKTDDGYNARPFNFYSFPRPIDVHTAVGKVQRSLFFTIDTSSIDFLRQHNMDFGRWMSKGVTYSNKNIEERLQKVYKLGEGNASNEDQRKPVELKKEADIAWLKDVMEKIQSFLDKKEEKEFKLPTANSFLILALHQALRKEHPQLEIEKRQTGTRAWEVERFVLNLTEEEKKERAIAQEKEYENAYSEHLGLRSIWKALGEANIPIATHNGYLDLLFISQALGFELPETLELFKDSLQREVVGSFYDTKLLADRMPKVLECKSTVLGELHSAMMKKDGLSKFVCPAPFDAYENDTSREHEAGYDALLTGKLFAFFREQGDIDQYSNHIFMMRSLFALDCKNVIDPLVRPHCVIFRLYDFERSFKNPDFMQILEPIVSKYPREDISLNWIDDHSLYLLVPKPAEEEVEALLKKKEDVMKFEPYTVDSKKRPREEDDDEDDEEEEEEVVKKKEEEEPPAKKAKTDCGEEGLKEKVVVEKPIVASPV